MAELHRKLINVSTSPVPGHAQMVITKPEAQFVLAFPDGVVVGEANAQLDGALESIMEQGYEIDLEAFAPIANIQETIGRAAKEKEAIVRVQINVYGPRTAACNIGRELSQRKIYLQRPVYIRNGCRYENPHMLTLPGFHSSSSAVPVTSEESIPEKADLKTLRSTLQDVYSSLTRDRNLHGLDGDERLNTPLLLYVQLSSVPPSGTIPHNLSSKCEGWRITTPC
jgi:SWI/SNF-related matrix-associated actin-dependent regulator of chromatin subfamily A3